MLFLSRCAGCHTWLNRTKAWFDRLDNLAKLFLGHCTKHLPLGLSHSAKACFDLFKCVPVATNIYQQGGHKPGKLREFEKLSKSQGKHREISPFVEKPGKLRENENIWHDPQQKCTHRNFLSWVAQGFKSLKYPGDSGNLPGNLHVVSQKYGCPDKETIDFHQPIK